MSRILTGSAENYDRIKELKAFDDTKAGVKGLIDSGITKVPKIFIRPHDELIEDLGLGSTSESKVPAIDLSAIGDKNQRENIVRELRQAAKDWGFFQVLNHGVPLGVLDGMLEGIRGFHEQDLEIKKEFYSNEEATQVRYASNVDLYRSRAANWRDTLTISMLNCDHVQPDELPAVCRNTTIEYIDQITKLGETILELLSEALGLKPEHLGGLACAQGRVFLCHYYPACPEPELTLGTSKHTDPAFLTILVQDQIGSLQVRQDNRWVDVHPVKGGLVVNIGDLLQIMSNDEFISAEHRVLANNVGPRISVACFFMGAAPPTKLYAPIKELISQEKPQKYKEFTVSEYIAKFYSRPIDKSGLDDFILQEASIIDSS